MQPSDTDRGGRKTSLIDFQRRLHERLSASVSSAVLDAHLGFELGAQGWLVPMSAVSEVLPVPYLEPVPLAKPWFGGVANVRGALFGVIDLQYLLHDQPTRLDSACRILLINRARLAGAAWLVSRTVGIRRRELLASADTLLPKFAIRAFREGDSTDWLELDAEGLLADPEFLRITRLNH